MFIAKRVKMEIRKNALNVTKDIMLIVLLGCVQLLILLAKRLIWRQVRASHAIMVMFWRMVNATLTPLYQGKMPILIASSLKEIHAYNATKDTSLLQTTFVHKLTCYVRHTQKTTATVHLVTQVTSFSTINAFPHKIFTFLSVK